MKAKKIALVCLLIVGFLLTSCGKIISFPEKKDPDLGLGVLTHETETESAGPSDPAKLIGNWYSYSNLSFFTFAQDGKVTEYSITPGYFEYSDVFTGTYTYDGTNLKMTVDGDELSCLCSVEDSMILTTGNSTITYLPSESLPTEHIVYPFPDFAEIIRDMKVDVPTCTGLTLKTSVPDEIAEDLFQTIWQTQTNPALATGTAKAGDLVNIDYAGYRLTDGEKDYFEGGTASGQILYAADGHGYVDGFGAQIAGHSTEEETFTVAVTFPENYYAELAGVQVFFEMKLNGIYPQVTDEMVKTYTNGEFETYADLLASEVREALKDAVLDLIPKPEIADGDVPFAAYAFALQYNQDRLHQIAFNYSVDYETILAYYSLTEETLKTTCIGIAKESMVVYLISRALDLHPDDQKRAEYTEEMIASYLAGGYGETREEAEAYFRENAAELDEQITTRYLIEYLVDHNTFVKE